MTLFAGRFEAVRVSHGPDGGPKVSIEDIAPPQLPGGGYECGCRRYQIAGRMWRIDLCDGHSREWVERNATKL